ncbi:MAG: endonuclease/exonuclease/phosphatase family protein [Sphaerochaetaceae bacterium]|nr:endonuclease/exonuclease/phosphatase family protein [Sphaerochaetaceae bacterium]
MKKFLKVLAIVLLSIIGAFALFVAVLSILEFRPADVEDLTVESAKNGTQKVEKGEELSLLCWNIGYAGLGKEMDFFMDGGTMSNPGSKDIVERYLSGIDSTIDGIDPDLVMLQEVDSSSSRTYKIDERKVLGEGYDYSSFALNYSCLFVPIPFPPMGTVHSGLYTMTDDLVMDEAQRYSLYCPFSWPVRVFNLRRCLMASYLPIEGSDKYLVLVNLHLEAYTEGDGRDLQTRQLLSLLEKEYEKGNYVIAAGDFNQFMPGSREIYPKTNSDWETVPIDDTLVPEGWTFAYDLSVPTCRSLNQAYDSTDENFQYYSIDAMILSPNINVLDFETIDEHFENSDHNPILLKFSI